MQIVLLIVKLIPTIFSLVTLAEKLFLDKPQSGAEKKNFVLAVLESLSGGASSVLTGGAADTWVKIKDPISMIVDAAATIAFPHLGSDANVPTGSGA